MGAEAAKLYTGVAAVLVESAAPYSLTGIAFLVPYARGSLYSVVFGQIWAKVTVSGQARHSWRIMLTSVLVSCSAIDRPACCV